MKLFDSRKIFIACLLALPLAGHAATYQEAYAAARAGRADDAVNLLKSVLQANPNDDKAQLLLCKVYKSTEKFDDAIRACETAVRLQPTKSNYQLELARVYGAKADHSGALTGMRLVGHIRDSFQKAVALDPKNVEAMSDLGEFYVDAPGIVGGGTDKARALIPKLLPLNPARGHRLAAQAAAKDGDYATAEAEYAKEIAAAKTPEAYVDQATYYYNRKNWDKAAQQAVAAINLDTRFGADAIDAANLLLKLSRSLDVAEKAYRGYLNSPLQSASVPAFQVHAKLGDLLVKRGDTAGAKKEYAAALELAHDYPPAKKGLGQ